MKLKKFNEYRSFDDEDEEKEDPRYRYDVDNLTSSKDHQDAADFLKQVDNDHPDLFKDVKSNIRWKGLKYAQEEYPKEIKHKIATTPGPYKKYGGGGIMDDVTQTQLPLDSKYKDVTSEELDKLNIIELVEKFSKNGLVTRSGYFQENQLGFIPSYVNERIHKEATKIPNSNHTYDTWDSYTLYKPKIDSEKVIQYVNVRSERGSKFSVGMC